MRRALAVKSNGCGPERLAFQMPAKIAIAAPAVLANMLTQMATNGAMW
jgi:hypothetical protein